MKKLFLWPFALGLLFLSCNKSQLANPDADRLESQILAVQKSLGQEDSLRDWYFNKANAPERYSFWFNKVKADLEYLNFNDAQSDYVIDLFQIVDVADFQFDHLIEHETRSDLEAWLNRADSYDLARRDLVSILLFLSPAQSSVGISSVDACGCSEESDWCDFLNHGPSSTCSASCDMERSRGCGTLLLYPCDKDCTF